MRKAGFDVARVKGSHHFLRHADGRGTVVPVHSGETLGPGLLYDEVATSRRLNGVGDIIPCWQAWKGAMPDVKGSVTNAVASGNTVVLEVTWEGTHTGPLAGPKGAIPPPANDKLRAPVGY